MPFKIRMCLIMAESPCLAKQNPPRSAWQWKIPGLADDSADRKPAESCWGFPWVFTLGFSNSSCFITEGYELIWPRTGKRSTGHWAHLNLSPHQTTYIDGPWNLLIGLSQGYTAIPHCIPSCDGLQPNLT